MLALPTTNFGRSVRSHNVALDVLCDWIEASALFVEDELSLSDVVDALEEEHIYDHPGSNSDRVSAHDRVSDGWAELEKRLSHLGKGSALQIVRDRIVRCRKWQDVPDHAFCLILSYAKWNRDWWRVFGANYNEQGELFERFTLESMKQNFPGWEIHPTGWTRTHASKLADVVRDVATRLGESVGNIERWTKTSAHEAGLDLVCYRPFPDKRVGIPVYLMQCGSGGDWEGKFATPNPRIWNRIVEFAASPKKAFSTPFAFLDDDFIRNTGLVDGLLLDRYRLLGPYREKRQWLSPTLERDLNKWMKPRVLKLPVR